MLQARMAANESSAIQGCRTIGSAEVAYASINNQTYTDLATLVTGGFLDDRFGGAAALNGYTYAEAAVTGALGGGVPPEAFGFVAQPQTSKGRYAYGIGPDQVVRYQGIGDGAPAGTVAMMCGSAACAEGDPIGKTTAGGGS